MIFKNRLKSFKIPRKRKMLTLVLLRAIHISIKRITLLATLRLIILAHSLSSKYKTKSISLYIKIIKKTLHKEK